MESINTDEKIIHRCVDGLWYPYPSNKCCKCINMNNGASAQEICNTLNALNKLFARHKDPDPLKEKLGAPFE